MNKSRRRSLTLFLLWLITLSHQIQSVVCELGQYNQEKPSFYQVVSSTMSLLKKSHKNSWEKIKTIIHDFQLQFIPPNLDFRGIGTAKARVSESGGEDMKGAVKKNTGTSKLSVEETAKSAAEFAGEAAHRTAEKVKEIVSDKEESHDEL